MVLDFFAPKFKSVRTVGCGDRVRVSGGHLCAEHRSTDRGGSRRDLEPVIAQRLCLCLHSCGARHCARLERGALVDRGASFCSLFRPPGALATSLRKPSGRRFKTISITKKSQTPYGYLRFLVAGTGLEPATSGL